MLHGKVLSLIRRGGLSTDF